MGRLDRHRGRAVLTYHKDYSYFAVRFGIRVAGYVEPKPGISPSPKHLEELSALLSRGDVGMIISRPYVEHRSTDMLEERSGVKSLTLPMEVGGAPEATDYFRLYDLVTETIAAALARPASSSGR